MCKWGEISPALKVVTLPGNTSWMRFKGLWLPSSNNEEEAFDFKWFLRAVVTLPTLPPEYLTFAKDLAGEDGILAVRKAIENDGAVPNFPPTAHNVFILLLFGTDTTILDISSLTDFSNDFFQFSESHRQ
ncbi:hypothetical protein B0H17DRAFT_1191822 [Mycena rosella]|uniref:Uncharacterized protein n=1 Tax=Mycena rosella TaxID=1033263 RepID=A0AAD7GYV7_MYCRO|nr:hypothetical protein B0H17DRAFT_1191822 [Mycena rosella]